MRRFEREIARCDLGELIEHLVTELARADAEGGDRQALLVLRFLSIVDGGLRRSTLIKLARQWRQIASEGLFEDRLLPEQDLTEEEIDRFVGAYRNVVVQGRDERIAPLDDFAHQFESFELNNGSATINGGQSQVLSLEIPDAVVRNAFERQLKTGEELGVSRLMHRLVAEEALHQQTVIMRHAHWIESVDIRHYRRLLEALYHGFASLPEGLNSAAPLRMDLPHDLPNEPVAAYRRLSFGLYRLVLERPPEWAMSRWLGSSSVKMDLLSLALDPAIYRQRVDADTADKAWDMRVTPYLQPRDAKADFVRDGRLLLDLSRAFGHAALRSNDLTRVQKIAEWGRQYLTMSHDANDNLSTHPSSPLGSPPNERARARLPFETLEIERLILRDRTDEAAELCIDALQAQDFKKHSLDPLDQIAALVRSHSPTERGQQLDAHVQGFVADLIIGRTADTLDIWSTLISYYAEIAAMSADKRFKRESRHEAIPDFFHAYILFLAAHQIRRSIFAIEPLGNSYVVRGHTTRVFIRVALQLVKIPRKFAEAGGNMAEFRLPDEKYFILRARRQADMLARYLARYPTEKASMLILESVFLRLLGGQTCHLLQSAELLGRAERLLPSTVDHPRMTMRFLLERAKIYRGLASRIGAFHEDPAGSSRAARYIEIALNDADELCFLADKGQCIFWSRLGSIQSKASKELRERLGLGPQKVTRLPRTSAKARGGPIEDQDDDGGVVYERSDDHKPA